MVTGRDLIIYILKNNLENEPVFKDGTFVGFVPVHQAATKMGVGSATIFALVRQNNLDYISIGDNYFISDMKEIGRKGE